MANFIKNKDGNFAMSHSDVVKVRGGRTLTEDIKAKLWLLLKNNGSSGYFFNEVTDDCVELTGYEPTFNNQSKTLTIASSGSYTVDIFSVKKGDVIGRYANTLSSLYAYYGFSEIEPTTSNLTSLTIDNVLRYYGKNVEDIVVAPYDGWFVGVFNMSRRHNDLKVFRLSQSDVVLKEELFSKANATFNEPLFIGWIAWSDRYAKGSQRFKTFKLAVNDNQILKVHLGYASDTLPVMISFYNKDITTDDINDLDSYYISGVQNVVYRYDYKIKVPQNAVCCLISTVIAIVEIPQATVYEFLYQTTLGDVTDIISEAVDNAISDSTALDNKITNEVNSNISPLQKVSYLPFFAAVPAHIHGTLYCSFAGGDPVHHFPAPRAPVRRPSCHIRGSPRSAQSGGPWCRRRLPRIFP